MGPKDAEMQFYAARRPETRGSAMGSGFMGMLQLAKGMGSSNCTCRVLLASRRGQGILTVEKARTKVIDSKFGIMVVLYAFSSWNLMKHTSSL